MTGYLKDNCVALVGSSEEIAASWNFATTIPWPFVTFLGLAIISLGFVRQYLTNLDGKCMELIGSAFAILVMLIRDELRLHACIKLSTAPVLVNSRPHLS